MSIPENIKKNIVIQSVIYNRRKSGTYFSHARFFSPLSTSIMFKLRLESFNKKNVLRKKIGDVFYDRSTFLLPLTSKQQRDGTTDARGESDSAARPQV